LTQQLIIIIHSPLLLFRAVSVAPTAVHQSDDDDNNDDSDDIEDNSDNASDADCDYMQLVCHNHYILSNNRTKHIFILV
jgi:hypothetical protein